MSIYKIRVSFIQVGQDFGRCKRGEKRKVIRKRIARYAAGKAK